MKNRKFNKADCNRWCDRREMGSKALAFLMLKFLSLQAANNLEYVIEAKDPEDMHNWLHAIRLSGARSMGMVIG